MPNASLISSSISSVGPRDVSHDMIRQATSLDAARLADIHITSWQAAYAELVFMDLLWPDFNKQSLEEAVDEYYRRERRYGATGDQ